MLIALSALAISCAMIEPPSPPLPIATISPPVIPHSTEGRDDCRACHAQGIGGAPQFPANHVKRPSDVCLACHESSGSVKTPVPYFDTNASPFFYNGKESVTHAPGTPAPVPTTPPAQTTPTVTASAEELFATKCAVCHGANRQGVPGLAPALTPQSLAALGDAEIRNVILDGRTGTAMPGFKASLSPEDIDALLQLIKSPSP